MLFKEIKYIMSVQCTFFQLCESFIFYYSLEFQQENYSINWIVRVWKRRLIYINGRFYIWKLWKNLFLSCNLQKVHDDGARSTSFHLWIVSMRIVFWTHNIYFKKEKNSENMYRQQKANREKFHLPSYSCTWKLF